MSNASRPPEEKKQALDSEEMPSYTTEQLFEGSMEILLKHGTTVYRLRRTSLGKLILTK